jgi:hypothetical protein
VLDLLLYHHGDALGHDALVLRVTRRGRPPAPSAEVVIGQPGHDPRHHGHPVRAGGQDVVVARLGGQVQAEPGRLRRRVPALRQPDRVVRHLLVQHRAARPGVGDEDQMAQRLRERPLLVNLLGQRGRRQPPGPFGGLRPQPLDGVPHGPETLGRPDLAELLALGVPPV